MAELPPNIINTPNNSKISIIGSNHHFFRSFKNRQISINTSKVILL